VNPGGVSGSERQRVVIPANPGESRGRAGIQVFVRAGFKPAPTGFPPFDVAQDMLSRERRMRRLGQAKLAF